MSTTIRPELSEKNQYWIERHRYYELKHFCLQYPYWRKNIEALDGLSKRPINMEVVSNTIGDPTARAAIARAYYANRMHMVEQTACESDSEIGKYILIGITDGVSYDTLNMRTTIPCSKDRYYNLYRRFFWLLDKARK